MPARPEARFWNRLTHFTIPLRLDGPYLSTRRLAWSTLAERGGRRHTGSNGRTGHTILPYQQNPDHRSTCQVVPLDQATGTSGAVVGYTALYVETGEVGLASAAPVLATGGLGMLSVTCAHGNTGVAACRIMQACQYRNHADVAAVHRKRRGRRTGGVTEGCRDEGGCYLLNKHGGLLYGALCAERKGWRTVTWWRYRRSNPCRNNDVPWGPRTKRKP